MKPVNRKEIFMTALAKGEEVGIEPVTREEMLLAEQAKREAGSSGGGGGGVSAPHITITMRVLSGGADLAFGSAQASISYEEAMNLLINGELKFYTYTIGMNANDMFIPIECGISPVFGGSYDENEYTMINYGEPLGIKVNNFCGLLTSNQLVWTSEDIIELCEN